MPKAVKKGFPYEEYGISDSPEIEAMTLILHNDLQAIQDMLLQMNKSDVKFQNFVLDELRTMNKNLSELIKDNKEISIIAESILNWMPTGGQIDDLINAKPQKSAKITTIDFREENEDDSPPLLRVVGGQ